MILSEALIHVYSRMLLRVVLLLYSFSSIGPSPALSGPPEQCWTWVPSHKMGLDSNQILVGYSHKLWATVASMYIAVRSVW